MCRTVPRVSTVRKKRPDIAVRCNQFPETNMRSILFLLVFVVSCSGTIDRGSVQNVQFNLSWHQEKDERDIVQCHYLKTPNDEALEVDRFSVDFPVGSHHVHIYRSDTPEPDGVKECTAGIDWNRWSLVVGVQ